MTIRMRPKNSIEAEKAVEGMKIIKDKIKTKFVPGIRRFGRKIMDKVTQPFVDEAMMMDAKDKKQRSEAPVGAYGGTNTGEYKPGSK